MRQVLLVTFLLACASELAVAPAIAQEPFDPLPFIGQGDAYNCIDFMSQGDAQAVLRADPGDPNRLDADRDGIACETLKGAQDREPVAR